MKRFYALLILASLVSLSLAQAPKSFTYQTIVKSENNLMANTTVGARVNILNSTTGSSIYREAHIATTNGNGLLTLYIGNGIVQLGDFEDIDWSNTAYSLKLEIDPSGGSNYSLVTTEHLNSVPYALYAEKASGCFSGDYNDLSNAPTIPSVPTAVSSFANDAQYITDAQIPSLVSAHVHDSLYNIINTLRQNTTQRAAGLDSLGYTLDSILNGGFVCGIGKVYDFDGNCYSTVQLGHQCWMRENLRTRHYSDGTAIPYGAVDSYTAPFYAIPSSSVDEVESGLHYSWVATMHGDSSSNANPSGVQGVCPNGWHVPSRSEWVEMLTYVQNDNYGCGGVNGHVAKALSTTSGWWDSTDTCSVGFDQGSNNSTLFSAYPAAHTLVTVLGVIRNPYMGRWCEFWTSTSADPFNDDRMAEYIWFQYDAPFIYVSGHPSGYQYNNIFSQYRDYGLSVRCIRDIPAYNPVRKTLPVIKTKAVSSIKDTTAACGGIVEEDGNAKVVERGICWSTFPDPTIAGSHIANGSDLGSFNVTLTNLQPRTTYYVRAYATNSEGTAYGNQYSFTTTFDFMTGQPCPNVPTVVDADSNVYNTVLIGTHCWTKENLRVTTTPTGVPIPEAQNIAVRSSSSPYRYVPGDMDSLVTVYGYLYNWTAYMNGASASDQYPSHVQGICPTGWHLPSKIEWDEFITYVSNNYSFSCRANNWPRRAYIRAIASTSGWDHTSDTCAVGFDLTNNNATGFTAYPASAGGFPTAASYIGKRAYFATTSRKNSTTISFPLFSYGSMDMGSIYSGGDFYGVSVRCILDYEPDSNATFIHWPEVTTDNVTDVTDTTATFGGEVLSAGGGNITARGVCWSLSPNPTIDDEIMLSGTGLGAFTCSVSNLIPNSTYYYRAFAVNEIGVGYGEEKSFVSVIPIVPVVTPPVVTTYPVTDITLTSAIVGGMVNNDGGAWVSSYGICWSIYPNPTIDDNHYDLGSGVETFTTSLSNLYMSMTYYVRAYATNSAGTSYGNVVVFQTATPDPLPYNQICPGHPIVIDYDGNVYNTVRIGTQCWMKENLKTTHYQNGTEIPSASNYSNTPARYSPGGNSTNVNAYGYLYNWPAVMNGEASSNNIPSGVQGICPPGWHVPSLMEYTVLFDFVKTQFECQCNSRMDYIAKSLCDRSETYWTYVPNRICAVGNSGQGNNNNTSGFSARPAGFYQYNYYNFKASTLIWTSSEYLSNTQNAYFIAMEWYSPVHGHVNYPKIDAMSVRCLLDTTLTLAPTVYTTTTTNITTSSAMLNGNVTHDGGLNLSQRGFCWSTSPNPTLSDAYSINGSSVGLLNYALSGLDSNTLYYVRAYAINAFDTVYGNETSFYTLPPSYATDGQPCASEPFLLDYDGNYYSTIQLGTQCWMRENMRTTHFNDGREIPLGTNNGATHEPFRYFPDSVPDNVNAYGYLYNWVAAAGGIDTASSASNPFVIQGLCPSGWHVPSTTEWRQLRNYLKQQAFYTCQHDNVVGKALSSTTGWFTHEDACSVGNYPMTNNISGFNAYPAGEFMGYYHYDGLLAMFWSANKMSSSLMYTFSLYYSESDLIPSQTTRATGNSLRCLKN